MSLYFSTFYRFFGIPVLLFSFLPNEIPLSLASAIHSFCLLFRMEFPVSAIYSNILRTISTCYTIFCFSFSWWDIPIRYSLPEPAKKGSADIIYGAYNNRILSIPVKSISFQLNAKNDKYYTSYI